MLLLLGAILALAYLYWYLTRTHDHWAKQKNVPTLPGCWPGVGHMLPSLLMRESLDYLADRAYREAPGQDASAVGIYFMRKPMLVLRHPDLVKQVLQSDFASFHYNGRQINPKADAILAKNPFFIHDMQAWRESRARVVGLLSGKKLSCLFAIARDVSEKMTAFVERRLAESTVQEYEADLKKLFVRYTGEMVANSAFEVEGRCFSDEREPGSFHVVAEGLFEPSLANVVKQAVVFFLPELAGFADVRFLPRSAEDFFRETLLSILKHRREQPRKPDDFLQFVLDTNDEDDIESIVADLLIYHMDVYETSSMTLAFFVYQLARNPEEQDKIRRHVRDASSGQPITYESLKAMGYLEQAVYESLRLIAPTPALYKRCSSETTLLGEDGAELCRLRPGDGVLIPVQALQNDPRYWPEPEAFRPDRFGPEQQLGERNRYQMFLAFGEGPRMCVGMRLGLMLVKLAAAQLLLRYRLAPSAKSPWPLEMDRTSFLTYAKGGVWATFRRLEEEEEEEAA